MSVGPWHICLACGVVAKPSHPCSTGNWVEAAPVSELREAREALGAVKRAVDVIEEWGANAAQSEREGDIADERYKAFDLAAFLIRSKLPAALPVEEER